MEAIYLNNLPRGYSSKVVYDGSNRKIIHPTNSPWDSGRVAPKRPRRLAALDWRWQGLPEHPASPRPRSLIPRSLIYLLWA